jgi:hypothetical protein
VSSTFIHVCTNNLAQPVALQEFGKGSLAVLRFILRVLKPLTTDSISGCQDTKGMPVQARVCVVCVYVCVCVLRVCVY